jgi:hypothetical protein
MPINFRFEGKRPLLRELTAERLNQLIIELQRAKPLPGRGISARQEAGGVRLDVLGSPTGGSSGDGSSHPFKVVTKKIGETWHWGVVPNSRIFTGIDPYSVTPDGALTTRNDDDPGWFEIQAGSEADYIYLQYDATAFEASIDSVGNGGSFDPAITSSDEGSWLEIDFEVTPPQFKFARKIIARAEESEDPEAAPTIVQGIRSHQLLQDICYGGTPAQWWFDYSGGTLA